MGLDWDMSFYRSYDAAIGRFMQVDLKPTFGISNYASRFNNPMLYEDMLGDTAWIPTRQWEAQDLEGYQDFSDAEIKRMQSNGEESDCADLACKILIRYASQEGLEVEFTKPDGTKLNSTTDETTSAEDFEAKVNGSTNAESIKNDMVEINNPNSGDLTNNGFHVNVVTYRVEGVVYDISQPLVPSSSGSLPDRVPRNSTIYTKGTTFKRWNVVQSSNQKHWNLQKKNSYRNQLLGIY